MTHVEERYPQMTQIGADLRVMEEKDFLFKEETRRIIGACFEVYNKKGCGFLEPVYQECLGIEFDMQKIAYDAERVLSLEYKGRPLQQVYKPDFICFERIIVELKAVSNLVDGHRAQLLNYLAATGFEVGLLINFGHYPGLEFERLANTKRKP